MKNNNIKSIFRLETIYLWIFPVIAIIFSTWAVIKYMDTSGKEIQVYFNEATSIVAGKTKVLYRGIQIGTVEEVEITEDGKRVICDVELMKSAEKFAVVGSKFYLVTPKVGFDQVSGLDAIMTGSYIILDPNLNSKEEKTTFEGNSDYNPTLAVENMTKYYLETDHAESISSGDNIYYRGIVVGKVGDVTLSPDSKKVIVSSYIQNKLTKIIRTNTVFWKKQGIKADLGILGSDIRINSLDTIMKGGIELATPNSPSGIANAHHKFKLLDNEPEAREKEKWEPELKFSKKNKRLANSLSN